METLAKNSSSNGVKRNCLIEESLQSESMDGVPCSSSNADDSAGSGEAAVVITEKMLLEERSLEKKSAAEELKLRKKEMETAEQKEMSYKRLRALLSRSGIYAKIMAEKLQSQTLLDKKSTERQQLKVITNQDNSKKRGTKRKVDDREPKKKSKSDVNAMDVYKDEAMRNKIMDELKIESEPKAAIIPPKLLVGGSLRDYQLEGFEWMKTLFENGVNGILADEMGLGKTIQCIAVIAYLIEMGIQGPFLVVGPLSTLPNWCAEIKKFTPNIPFVLYHGSKEDRNELRKAIFKRAKVGDFYTMPIVVTSYSIALRDTAVFRSTVWKMLAIDEAHRIKNYQCKLVQALKSYHTSYRLLLTGTPLQNDLSELWSLLNYILPEIFNDLQVFQTWFDISNLTQRGATEEIVAQEQEKQIVSMIHEILTPFLLRRTKADVVLRLPPKKELIVHAPLSALQMKYYSSVLNKSIEKLLGVKPKEEELPAKRRSKKPAVFGCEQLDLANISSKASVPDFDSDFDPSEVYCNVRNIAMILRKICGHPYLLSYPIDPRTNDYLVDENIVKHSGKLRVMDLMLPELQKRGHKILLFSQFVTMIRILEDYCHFRGYKYCQLHGTMSLAEREDEMRRFREDSSMFIFLISTKAGGLGINLVEADTVIIYDSDWNPQGDLQAQDRCHRIGQNHPVVVYRLVVPNTIDEKIIERAAAKRKLEKAIIHNGRFKSKSEPQSPFSLEELLKLLQSSDVNGLVNADDWDLSSGELEKILDRSDMMLQE